jgi:hypothetical protein
LKHDFFIDSLHIFVLCSFAIAQPLFDLLSRNAEFFVARHSEPIDIVLLTLILIIPFPALIVLIEAITGLVSHQARKIVHGFVIACLMALIALPLLKMIDIFSGTIILLLAGLVGTGFMLIYIRFQLVKKFLAALSPALLIFPALFLFNSPVYNVLFLQEMRSIEEVKNNTNSASPIIVVIFDEFPVTSLMDENRHIDAIRYPNFSALANSSYWFRNATTVSPSTYVSIPAMLTGNYPDGSEPLPTVTNYPYSLFTLLGVNYNMKVTEMITKLYPEKRKKKEILVKRAISLLRDLGFVYLHIIIPDEFCENLPDVRQTWENFVKRVQIRGNRTHYAKRMEEFDEFVESITTSERPTLFFLDIMLPHVPWEYYPSGKKYNAGWWAIPGYNKIKKKWGNNPWLVTQAYQRHLLQVGAVDMLLGKLIAHLKRIGLYDSSLIIITADHGTSFLPGQTRRGVNDKTFQDIIPIPLFIKAPNQHKGIISDQNVETVDIFPTIADILGIRIPWPVDGCSMLNTNLPERSKKILYYRKKKLVYESNFKAKYDTLRKKIALFGSETSRPNGLFRIGPHNELVSRKVSEINIVEEKNFTLEIDQRDLFGNVEIESVFVPGYITGCIFTNGTDSDTPINLAVSVNGIIHAVTQTYRSKDGKNRFSFLVPDKAFHVSSNDVEVFIVSIGTDGQFILHAAKKASSVNYTLAGNIITSSDGKKYPLIKGALKGHLAEANVFEGCRYFEGWIYDIKNFQLPEAILVFDDEKFIFSGRMNKDRPDVVKVFPDYPLKTGFHFVLPLRLIQDLDNSKVHLFALLKSGEACKIYCPKRLEKGK